MEWVSKQSKKGEGVSIDEIEEKEKEGEILEYEIELIPLYKEIVESI